MFDSIRHSTLLDKIAQLDILAHVHNWLAEFFTEHSHCNDQTSTLKKITASVIQGSAIGPAAYVVTAGNLRTMDPGNQLVKFADDTYIIIPASNHHIRAETWVKKNNLALNKSKTKEVIRRKKNITTTHPLSGINRENSLKILSVTFTSNLSASDHIRGIISDCAQTQYAM